MNTQIISIGLILFLLVSLASPASAATYDIDENHSLDCEAFAETGSTSDSLTVPDATISLEDDVEDGSIGEDYFVVDYNESLNHTIRVYIPSECVGPYTDTSVSPVQGDGPTAQYEVIGDREYLSIKVTLDSKGTYKYPIGKEKSVGFWIFGKMEDRNPVDDDEDAPSQWSYINDSTLDNYGEKTLKAENPEEVSIQQKKSNGKWVKVGDRDDYNKVFAERNNTSITVVSTVADAPEVRYNRNPSVGDTASGAIADAQSAIDAMIKDIQETINSIFG